MPSLELHCDLSISKEQLFASWVNQYQQGAITQALAKIEPEVNGVVELWNAAVTGRILRLEANRRISMTWRTVEFSADQADTLLTLSFEDRPKGCRLLVHRLVNS